MYISKTKLMLTGIFAASLIIIITAYSQKDNTATAYTTQGQQPYTPNRLEWLELKLTAALGNRVLLTEDETIIRFKAEPERNTIYLLVWYNPNTKANFLQEHLIILKSLALEEIEDMGWDDWVKLEVKSSERGTSISLE